MGINKICSTEWNTELRKCELWALSSSEEEEPFISGTNLQPLSLTYKLNEALPNNKFSEFVEQ